MHIKGLNRKVYLELEEKRKETEEKKGVVDRLQLNYENLLYKQAYLQREIRACKDLATPNLGEVEKELGLSLATTTFSANLADIHSSALESLSTEQKARVETEKILEDLKKTRDSELKRLDRKRKFVDEVSVKVEQMNTAAKDLHAQFLNVQS